MVDRSGEPDAAAAKVDLARWADFQLGAAQVRPATREVAWPGGVQSVEPRVMRVLVALHRTDGGVVTRDDLIASCWDGVIVGEDAINRTIGRLRRLSETDAGASFRIETLPRVGFRLFAGEPADGAAPPPSRPRALGWAMWAGLVLLLLVAASAGVWMLRPPGAPRTDVGAPPVIAVLPFDTLGGTAAEQGAADALAMGLGDSLSRSGLRLIGSSSSFQFRGGRKAGAGRALGAQYVIDGSLRREGDRLKLALRMDDVGRGVTVWTSQFDEASSRPDRLQARAATALGAAIAWPAAARVMRGAPGLDPGDVGLFLESTGADRAGDYPRAFAAARRLMAAAPEAPMAQANLGIVTADALPTLPERERAQALSQARAAAELAVRRDPHLGEAFVAQALLLPRPRWNGRERLFDKAIAVDPDNGAAHIYYAAFLLDAGRIGDVLAVTARAEGLDPLSQAVLDRKALGLALAGKGDAADRLLAQAAEGRPDSASLVGSRMRLAMLLGRTSAARALLEDPVAGRVFVERGVAEPLRRLLEAMQQPEPGRIRAAVDACRARELSGYLRRLCVLGLAAAGDLDDAFVLANGLAPEVAGDSPADQDRRWLHDPEPAGGLYMLYAPGLRAFRADPRATALFERVGLAAYWRDSGRRPDFCAVEPAPICATLIKPPRP